MAGWDSLQRLVKEEVIQRRDEGCNTEGFIEKIEAAGNDREQLMAIYEQLMRLPIRPDFPFVEPSELEEIRKKRPEGPRVLHPQHSESVWRDKFYGAWLGRSVGCALGKPLEQWEYMAGSFGNPGWKNVQLWFQGADAWPITTYVPAQSRAQKEVGLNIANVSPKSLCENIRYMESDDDIRYTVLGLIMLEEKGLEWDSWDVGLLWHRVLSYSQVCTAETQAYLNFAQVTSHLNNLLKNEGNARNSDWEQQKDWVRTYLNPYREWIGAQIRADGLAYGAAGKPELAAELAWRDASFSHVKNGIYGEMFVAAMIAAAFSERDPERIVEIGLSEIPAASRLAKDVREAVAIARSTKDQVELVDRIWEAFKHYNPVHTNNNAALVAASLIFGQGDFEKAITTAVLGGWDTDCNGATIGSIMGAMLGAEAIPSSWTAPLNDILYAEINGFHPIPISECATRSFEVFKKLNPDSCC
ncbi:ADP-ribosylglycohydrolase family protein [Paenibacillus sp. IHBB 3054]|uniref:ADP-ribosylglycohydrolase family protein n=1 Tax=Paenibacillus sp. IHBB 3054 TaxID=3425689 RepID=UPI003F6690BA